MSSVTGLQRALAVFSTLDRTHFYMHFAEMFLAICERRKAGQPCTFHYLEETLGLSNSAISRTVQKLGFEDRKGNRGYGLVETWPDPDEGRRFVVGLTGKGEALLRLLEAC